MLSINCVANDMLTCKGPKSNGLAPFIIISVTTVNQLCLICICKKKTTQFNDIFVSIIMVTFDWLNIKMISETKFNC